MSWLSYGEGDSSEKSIFFFFFFFFIGMWVNFFAVFNNPSCLLPLSNDQMKTKMNVVTVVTKPWSGFSNGV